METHTFTPSAAADHIVQAAGGEVVVVETVGESRSWGPILRVRNIDNGREAIAFGSELDPGVTDG